MTPASSEARDLYTLRQKLEDCWSLSDHLALNRTQRGIGIMLFEIDAMIRRLIDNPKLLLEFGDLPTDILLVFSRLISAIDFEDACTVCGLAPSKTMTPREAESFLERAVLAHSRTVDASEGVITDVIIDWIVLRTKLNPRKLNGDRSHAAVLAWMSHCRSDRFLSEVAIRLGRVLSEGKGPYRSYFEGFLEKEREFNESGGHAKLAQKESKKTQREISDYQHYRIGRLPESHLQQLARRSVTRQFLKDLWASMSGSGQACS